MKKCVLYLLLLCTPLTPLMAVYDAETNETGYEVRLRKAFGQLYDDDIKVWITYPDGTVAKRITNFKHDGNTSDDRFFVPDYRVENGNDGAPYQSLKLRVHMQDPGKRGDGLFGIILNAINFPTTPQRRSHLIDIKLDRPRGILGLPFIDYATIPATKPGEKHPMFNFVSYDEAYKVDTPFTGAEHQKELSDASYINDDVIRVFLNLSITVMGE